MDQYPAKLSDAMAKAFAEIQGAVKDSQNPHFRSQYADLSSVVSAIKPALVSNGLFFVQTTSTDAEGVIVGTILCHQSGERVDLGTLFIPASRRDAQGFGSALTYARRYALMTAFGVCPYDDDGTAAVATQTKAAPVTQPAPQRKPNDGRHKAKQFVRELDRDIRSVDDIGALDGLLNSFADEIAKAQAIIPDWFDRGPDTPDEYQPINELIAEAREYFLNRSKDFGA